MIIFFRPSFHGKKSLVCEKVGYQPVGSASSTESSELYAQQLAVHKGHLHILDQITRVGDWLYMCPVYVGRVIQRYTGSRLKVYQYASEWPRPDETIAPRGNWRLVPGGWCFSYSTCTCAWCACVCILSWSTLNIPALTDAARYSPGSEVNPFVTHREYNYAHL